MPLGTELRMMLECSTFFGVSPKRSAYTGVIALADDRPFRRRLQRPTCGQRKFRPCSGSHRRQTRTLQHLRTKYNR